MKRTRALSRALSFIIIIALVLSFPSFAYEDRASDQIGRHDIKVTPLSGQIAIKASIFGMGTMNKIGCESIYLYRQYGSVWISTDWMLEDDYNMYSTNTEAHMANYYFNSTAGVKYRVDITLFAENDEGRDTVSQTFYVTGKSGTS